MASTLSYISYGVAAVMTVQCVRNITAGYVKEDFEVFKGLAKQEWFRLARICPVLVAIVFGLIIAAFTYPTGVFAKVLQWSWLSLIASKEDSAQGTNLVVAAGTNIPYFGVVFLALLFFNLPGMARNEEEMFRRGTKSWWDGVPRSLAFGMMHCIVGVPVAVGLALMIPGLWFTQEYFKGGIDRSTRVHAFYNMIMVPGLGVYAILATLHR